MSNAREEVEFRLEQNPAVGPEARKPRTWLRRIGLGSLALLIALGLLVLRWRGLDHPCEFDSARAEKIDVEPAQRVVPGPELPADLDLRAANNNLDLVQHQGAIYFAFRNAPHHFASADTRIVLLRQGKDEASWQTEAIFKFGADLREPRFLSFRGELFFYFFKGGESALSFAPDQMYFSRREGNGRWTDPEPFYEKGYVVWRAREFGGRAWMSVYRGEGLYSLRDRKAEVRLLVSEDGKKWAPISEEPQVTEHSASECDFVFDAEGNLTATVRLEMRGGLIARAKAGDLAHWETSFTPTKIDSACLFQEDGEVYLVARRSLSGDFDQEPGFLPNPIRRAISLARYSMSRKRSVLYRIEGGGLRPVLELAGRGDTAFAAVIPQADGRYRIYNYSSPLDSEAGDPVWLEGQLGPTVIYRQDINFRR